MLSKVFKIIFAIIGWFFVLFFIIFALVYHNYTLSMICYFICALLACPLIKRILSRLKLWLRIPLAFVIFIFATVRMPEDASIDSNRKGNDITPEYEDIEKVTEADSNIKESEPEFSDDVSTLSEEEFKNACIEITYNDLDDEWIGKYVTKEILFTSTEKDEYRCASTESFIEDWDSYQHVYTIYDIFDCRLDKSFPIYANDVIRIYEIITDVHTNYANGLEYPVIDMYYADYIREWKKSVEEAKSIEEL